MNRIWFLLTLVWVLGALLTNISWAICFGIFIWPYWILRLYRIYFAKHELIEGIGWVDVVCPKTDERYHYIICCPNTNYVVCKGCGKKV